MEGFPVKDSIPAVCSTCQAERFAVHKACWTGNLEELGRLLHLDDPDFVDKAEEMAELLLSEGRVEAETEKTVVLVDSPAMLAVKARHWECANTMLALILYRRLRHTPWIPPCNPLRLNTSAKGTFLLKSILAMWSFVSSNTSLRFFLMNISAENGANATLLVASLLGNAAIVKETLQHCSLFNEDDFCELAIYAACTHKDPDCLKLVLDRVNLQLDSYIKEINRHLFQVLWDCSFVHIKECLDVLSTNVSNGCLNGIIFLPKCIDFFSQVSKVMVHMKQNMNTKLMCLDKPLPSEAEVERSLHDMLPLSWDRVDVNEDHFFLENLGYPLFIQKPVVCRKLEEVLSDIFIHRACTGKAMAHVNALYEPLTRRSAGILQTLAQLWYLSRSQHPPLPPKCPFCHPLLKSLDACLYSCEELCEFAFRYLTTFLSRRDLKTLSDKLKADPPQNVCTKHKTALDEAKRLGAIEVIHDASQTVVPLRQICVKKVLDNLHGDRDKLRDLAMPGGLQRIFFLHDFVERIAVDTGCHHCFFCSDCSCP